MRAKTATTPLLTPEEKRELAALLADVREPDVVEGDRRITDAPLIRALDYWIARWHAVWRAWQYAGGPKPPAILAYQCHGGEWLLMGDMETLIAGLHELAD